MPPEVTVPPLLTALRRQADACASMGSPMYAELLERCADDLVAGGVVAEVLAGHEDDTLDTAIGLRLLGSVHRLVLERRAGALAATYPSVGGRWDLQQGWSAFQQLLADQPEAVREWLGRAPQTNEVGRAAALYGGLLRLGDDLPVRLVEIGCSGGLNLRADAFRYVDEAGHAAGDPDSPVVLEGAWRGASPVGRPAPRVVARVGCDLHPVDPATTAGRLALTAYVWADHADRLARLRAAFTVAARIPVRVVAQDACSFLDGLGLEDGTTTVLWHSVMWQYLSAAEQDRAWQQVERLGATATPERRFAHLWVEPDRAAPIGTRYPVLLTTWPGGEERLLGQTVGHGVPVSWSPVVG